MDRPKKMSRREKVDLINTLFPQVIDSEADGETCYYVTVLLDNGVRDVLKKLGKDDEWIDLNKTVEESGHETYEYFDLTLIAWNFARWWDSGRGFLLKKRKEIVEDARLTERP